MGSFINSGSNPNVVAVMCCGQQGRYLSTYLSWWLVALVDATLCQFLLLEAGDVNLGGGKKRAREESAGANQEGRGTGAGTGVGRGRGARVDSLMTHIHSWVYTDQEGHEYPSRQFYVATRDIAAGEEIMHSYSYEKEREEHLEQLCAWFKHTGLSHDPFEALAFAQSRAATPVIPSSMDEGGEGSRHREREGQGR